MKKVFGKNGVVGIPFLYKINYNCVVYAYAPESVTANTHRPFHLFFYGTHCTFVLNKKVKRFFARNFTFFGNKCTLLFVDIKMMVV